MIIIKKEGFNPYLPSWEYVPDAEPYVFNDRVYIYGSHDKFNGHAYCLNDYVTWSAPVDDLTDWKYEGVIYNKTDDPLNPDGSMCLYAPDVTQGPDGRYYLYYVLDKVPVVSVAVCSTPAGKFEFYGYVKDKNGHLLGEREGDEPQFDPGVLTEGNQTYLYTGFCSKGDLSRRGAMATVLGEDMLTIVEDTVFVLPSEPYSEGTGFEGYEFFEAPSIRKIDHTYYLIYSSIAMHELCYATSSHPTKGFEYQGVIISNNDLHIDSYKPAEKPMYYGGNNHGSIIQIQEDWFIFYHRHTNGSNFSRQGCLEKITVQKDGSIAQVEMTSNGPNQSPLKGIGEYPASIACHLFHEDESLYTGDLWMDSHFPKITQDGKDGDPEPGYIMNMTHTSTAGFKYFDCQGINKVKIKVRGYCDGVFEVRTAWDGKSIGEIKVGFTNVWTEYENEISIPDGVQSLYFTFKGNGRASLASFSLESRVLNLK
ncbi:MAG: family 43 glycosylhydrolase [Alkalibacterium sp.]|nr:family 43 glycosylhydrolase [Alkalibacterium sp.]